MCLRFVKLSRVIDPPWRDDAGLPGTWLIEEAGGIEGRDGQILEPEPIDVERGTALPPRLQTRRGIGQPIRTDPVIQNHRLWPQHFGR
jgi:hypothetical protein